MNMLVQGMIDTYFSGIQERIVSICRLPRTSQAMHTAEEPLDLEEYNETREKLWMVTVRFLRLCIDLGRLLKISLYLKFCTN